MHTEVCVDGRWQPRGGAVPEQALALGLGRLGSDRVEWPLDPDLLAGSNPVDLRVVAENPASGAHDQLASGGLIDLVDAPAGAAGGAIPLLPPWAAILLAVLLVAVARQAAGPRGTRIALALLFGLTLATPGARSRAESEVPSSWIDDRANDSVGADAGVDLTGAGLVEVGGSPTVRVELNHVAPDGLADGARVLFVGNSLTFVNDLPGMVRAVAAQAGRTVQTAEVSMADASLGDQWIAGEAPREIAKGYAIVVLQQGPSALSASQADLLKWTRTYNAAIRAAGGRPALYMVWPENARFEVFDDVRASYSNAAAAVDGMFLPAGESWRAAWAIDPDLALYGPDGFHPSELGTYAAALTIFSELFRQTPVDLPASLPLMSGRRIDFDPHAAAVVQHAAWQAHLAYGRAGR